MSPDPTSGPGRWKRSGLAFLSAGALAAGLVVTSGGGPLSVSAATVGAATVTPLAQAYTNPALGSSTAEFAGLTGRYTISASVTFVAGQPTIAVGSRKSGASTAPAGTPGWPSNVAIQSITVGGANAGFGASSSFDDGNYAGQKVPLTVTPAPGAQTVIVSYTVTNPNVSSNTNGNISTNAFELAATDTGGTGQSQANAPTIFAGDPASVTNNGVTTVSGTPGQPGYTANVPVLLKDANGNVVETNQQHPNYNPTTTTNGAIQASYSGPPGGNVSPNGPVPPDGGGGPPHTFTVQLTTSSSNAGTACVNVSVPGTGGQQLAGGSAYCTGTGAGNAAQLTLSSNAGSPTTNGSVTVTLSVTDANGVAASSPNALPVRVVLGNAASGNKNTVISGTGKVSAATLNGVSWTAANGATAKLTIPAGSSSATLTLTDTGVGTDVLTASCQPGANCAGIANSAPANQIFNPGPITSLIAYTGTYTAGCTGPNSPGAGCSTGSTFATRSTSAASLSFGVLGIDANGNVQQIGSLPQTVNAAVSSQNNSAGASVAPSSASVVAGKNGYRADNNGQDSSGTNNTATPSVKNSGTNPADFTVTRSNPSGSATVTFNANGVSGTLQITFTGQTSKLLITLTDPNTPSTGTFPSMVTADQSTTFFWVVAQDNSGNVVSSDNSTQVSATPQNPSLGTVSPSVQTMTGGIAPFVFTANNSNNAGTTGITVTNSSNPGVPAQTAGGGSLSITVQSYAPASFKVTVNKTSLPVSGFNRTVNPNTCQVESSGNFALVTVNLLDGSGNVLNTDNPNADLNRFFVRSVGSKSSSNGRSSGLNDNNVGGNPGVAIFQYDPTVAAGNNKLSWFSGNNCGDTPTVGFFFGTNPVAAADYGTVVFAVSDTIAENLVLNIVSTPLNNNTPSTYTQAPAPVPTGISPTITFTAGSTASAVRPLPVNGGDGDFVDPAVAQANGTDLATAIFQSSDAFGNPIPAQYSGTCSTTRGSVVQANVSSNAAGQVTCQASSTSVTPNGASSDKLSFTPSAGSSIQGVATQSISFATDKLVVTTSPANAGPNQTQTLTVQAVGLNGQIDTTNQSPIQVQIDDLSNPNVNGPVASPFVSTCFPAPCTPGGVPGAGNPVAPTLNNGVAKINFIVTQSGTFSIYAGLGLFQDKNATTQPSTSPFAPGNPTTAPVYNQNLSLNSLALQENRPLFTWPSSTGATGYQLQLLTGNPSPINGLAPNTLLAKVNTQNTSFLGNTSGLNGGNYAWAVIALDSSGNPNGPTVVPVTPFVVNWVQAMSVSTFDPGHPLFTWQKQPDECGDNYCNPPDAVDDNNGNDPSNISAYGIELLYSAPVQLHAASVDPSRLGAATIVGSPQNLYSNNNPPSSFSGDTRGLQSGHTYYVRVIAINPFGLMGGLSDAVSFVAP